MASHLFSPFRALGLCANHVPLALSVHKNNALLSTAIGRTFHVYTVEKLQLVFVGPLESDSISCLIQQGAKTISSAGGVLRLCHRGKEVAVLGCHDAPVHLMLLLGQQLVSVDEKNCLRIWSIADKELYVELEFDPDTFLVTCLVHPSTYLNKILLGSQQGQLQIWNIRSSKLIYTFNGWGSAVRVLAQSPALDIVGIGLESGLILIHNVRHDETLMKFSQDWGPVISLSFRTDGISTLVSGSPSGHVTVWDLDERRLVTVMHDAHSGSVTGMAFLPQNPLLLTTSSDNSVKMWIFDQSDGSARLLKQRQGHSAPPTHVRFYTAGGLGLLSAGLDNSLRLLVINKETMNKEMSQGALVRKAKKRGVKVGTLRLPPVTNFASEMTRMKEWDSVVTCHREHLEARTWNLASGTIGKHSLTSRHAKEGAAPQCCCVSGCGNFVVLGMSSGHLEVFNMQSGLHRGEIGRPRAHSGCVRGVAMDAVNMEIFSGSADKTIKFWLFYEKTLLHTLELESPVAKLCYHRDSSLLAIACDNFSVLVVDTDTRRIVRRFAGHKGRITDMALSPDSRWLVISSMDCVIRTWDLPSGRLLDCFLVESPATSLAFSPTGEFLVSSHVDDLGIYLWNNLTLYCPVSLKPLPEDYIPSVVQLPSTGDKQEEGVARREEDEEDEMERDFLEGDGDHIQSLQTGLVTLSGLPKSRWHNLHILDLIKQRSKPKEPAKTAKAAPFFLPTLPGVKTKFIPAEGDAPIQETTSSKLLQLTKLQPLSEVHKCLIQCSQCSHFPPLMELLKTLGTSAIDKEVMTLGPDFGGSRSLLLAFMMFLLDRIMSREDFELLQAYLRLFLKYHGDAVSRDEELLGMAKELLREHKKIWQGYLHPELNYCTCLLAYCKSTTV